MFTPGRAIHWSVEPYYWIARTGDALPVALGGQRDQFAMSLLFTPEGADNLRLMTTVYNDGDDYGRMVALGIPKGHYVMGPEQAESVIDQDPEITPHFQRYARVGTQIIRGHMSSLLVGNELIYVEPIFVRSQQLSVPQLKRVVVVCRGRARIGENLQEALERAITNTRDPVYEQVVSQD